MDKQSVRICGIEIENLKNVKYGILKLETPKNGLRANILGLYGQNGSGKTAAIDATFLLKMVLSGKRIPAQYADYINVDSDYAKLKFSFIINSSDGTCVYRVNYEFCLRKEVDNAEHNADTVAASYRVLLYDEVLSCSYDVNGKKTRMTQIVNTHCEGSFMPAAKRKLLIGSSEEAETNMLVAKKMAASTSRSFVFSRDMINELRKNCKEEILLHLFERMVYYGNYELFVINTTNSGLISFNALPLSFNIKDAKSNKISTGNMIVSLNMNAPTLIPDETADLIKKVIHDTNIVLEQLVPGLTIGIKDLGAELQADGNKASRIQLVSRRNGKEIPLQYESEGIKKIVSVLQLLIEVYNRPYVTVAIDELDSGIFEYLLGELLHIISEKGKGQLIFTSHNLRPLETIDKSFVAFTTANPENRYIRMENVKKTNNLRDFYFRDITLGGQSEPLYEQTNNSEIAYAFREAGDIALPNYNVLT